MRKAVFAALGGLLAACGSGDVDPAVRGARVYAANCIACHAPNPAQDGVLGPAVAGSSLELLEARVLRSEYPPGYTPRRETALMQPLPFLKNDLPALAAFLAEAGAK